MIALEPSIKCYEFSMKSLDFVGQMKVDGKFVETKFMFGAYGFSNPFSANMFAFLFRTYEAGVAISTVTLYEEELAKSAPAKFKEFVHYSWGKAFQAGNLAKGFEWQKIVLDLSVAAGGWAFTRLRLSGALANANPYSAKADQEEYVMYAIAYMKDHPEEGPAYKIAYYKK